MIALRRIVFAALLALVTIVVMRPLIASANDLNHGELVFMHNVVIAPDEVVDGDINVILGDARIAGHVRGDVNTFLGRCELLDSAVIDGEAHCVTDNVPRWIAPWIVNTVPLGSMADQNKHILVKLGASAIVLLVFLLFPVRMRLALDRVERHPGLAACVGTAAMVAVLPLALLLLFTVVGIPLIFVEAAALIVGIWLGTGAIALLIGRRLSELVMPRTTPSPLWALILGLVVVSAAETVPYVGWAVTALVWLVGLGAALLAFIPTASVVAFRGRSIGGPSLPQRPL